MKAVNQLANVRRKISLLEDRARRLNEAAVREIDGEGGVVRQPGFIAFTQKVEGGKRAVIKFEKN